jgi:hypothetical protein
MSWDIHKYTIYKKWKKYWYNINPPDIAEYSWNYLFTNGKEIRPRLFCELWVYLSPDSIIPTELAFAIECIHVASMILDDTPWMDNATERRGQKTLHVMFTPKKALLIVYELLIIVRKIWQNNKPIHISKESWEELLKNKIERLIIGQLYDIEKIGTIYEVASLKTGVLFELISETVAIYLDLDTNFWKVWGNNLGVLFQWIDDWNDKDEDKLYNIRNAFNEAYIDTVKNYTFLWMKIEQYIGSDWFLSEFGSYIKQYFTINTDIPHNIIKKSSIVNLYSILFTSSLPYISTIIIPKHIKHNIITDLYTFTGKDILRLLYVFLNELFTHKEITKNLWNINENEWEFIPEIKEILDRAKNE